jgi:hypothetical protein
MCLFSKFCLLFCMDMNLVSQILGGAWTEDLGCDTMQSEKCIPSFRRDMLSFLSGYAEELSAILRFTFREYGGCIQKD